MSCLTTKQPVIISSLSNEEKAKKIEKIYSEALLKLLPSITSNKEAKPKLETFLLAILCGDLLKIDTTEIQR
jgi:hypothetical protein